MGYKNYTVRVTYLKDETGAVEYPLPYVQQVSDPEPASKDVVIKGTRGDGSIRIKGGKQSIEIRIRGKLFDADGYKDLSTKIAEMRTKFPTDLGTLTMKYYDPDDSQWHNNWSYTGFRNAEIRFSKSDRTGSQEYSITFLVTTY